MILIFSIKNDFSTNEIIDYLLSKKYDFIRVNEDDFIEIERLDEKIIIKIKNTLVDFDSINSIWYRKSRLQIKKSNLSNKSLENFINEENNVLNEYLLFRLKEKINLGLYSSIKVNKLVVNELAKRVGLNTPQSFFRNSENFKPTTNLITKPINENSIVGINENSFYKLLTIDPCLINHNYEFSLSYFQEKIDKKYELRIFYLNGVTYSMAIFSQNNAKTNIDFRNYDSENPNRTVPYKLSNKMNEKIDNLMKLLGLNTGSIDILVDKNLNHYFLEVNPVGQFGMVSYPCNYNLEEKIANYLIDGKQKTE